MYSLSGLDLILRLLLSTPLPSVSWIRDGSLVRALLLFRDSERYRLLVSSICTSVSLSFALGRLITEHEKSASTSSIVPPASGVSIAIMRLPSGGGHGAWF